jgi:hypothetical protein
LEYFVHAQGEPPITVGALAASSLRAFETRADSHMRSLDLDARKTLQASELEFHEGMWGSVENTLRITGLSRRQEMEVLAYYEALAAMGLSLPADIAQYVAVAKAVDGIKVVEDRHRPRSGKESQVTIALVERPIRVHRDEDDRLHNVRGPAIEYEDGFRRYAVHGVIVPEAVITRPEEITVSEILAERNVNIRRVIIERYGEEKLLRQAPENVVTVRDRTASGVLRSLALDNDEPVVVVETSELAGADRGGANLIVRVPPHIQSVRAALAYINDANPRTYALGAD